MFDYTTTDGILRIFATEEGWFIRLQNEDQYEMGPIRLDFLLALYDPDDVPDAVSDETAIKMIEARKWELICDYFNLYKGDEAVCTDDELAARYRAEIRAWDWPELKRQAIQNYENSEDGESGFTWVGSYYAICPSGKVYAMWTSNQTEWDVRRDEIWWEAFEEVAGEHNMWQTDGGEGDHLYLGCDLPDGYKADREAEENDAE